ncbi:16626_t:CDS:2 [Funneliformis caledonium]|uniref:16626_t:CDS:1 n=1 Tax=Funneliformis caledonium TaxID=1117310 RepID=A0A9N9FX15_9GLOM|nr:16626_t:CDS:2 [Funneliformis caledonium]
MSGFGKCTDCGKERISDGWCNACDVNALKENFFGITKDYTSHFMLVMKYYEYYENRDLYSYLDETQGKLCWRDIVIMLWQILEGGIVQYHEKGLIHGNIHGVGIQKEFTILEHKNWDNSWKFSRR